MLIFNLLFKIGGGYIVCTPISDPARPSPPDLKPDFVFLKDNYGNYVFRKPVDNEWFVRYNSQTKKYGEIVKSKNFTVPYGCDERRYIVVPLEPQKITQPELQNPKSIPFSGPGKYRLNNGQIVNLDKYRSCKVTDSIIAVNGAISSWGWHSNGKIDGLGFKNHSHLFLAEKLEDPTICPPAVSTKENSKLETDSVHTPKYVVANKTIGLLEKGKAYEVVNYKPNSHVCQINIGPGYSFYSSDCFESEVSTPDITNPVMKDEEVMKKETAVKVATSVTKFVGNWAFRAANYWLFEPATNLGRPIVKSFRYAVFVSTLVGAGYAYNNPEVVKNAIKSCIPKVTIEAPEILRANS